MGSASLDVTHSRDKAIRGVLLAIGLTLAGIAGQQIAILPAITIDPGIIDGEPSRVGFMLQFSLGFVGMAAAGILYLLWTDRGLDYIDLRIPTLSDWKFTILGVLAGIGVIILVSILGQLIGIPGADHQIVDIVGDDSTLVLYLIVLVFLFNAPAEEFLFRNVIQKRLYTAFSRMGAVVVTSVIFAAIHFPVYWVTVESLSATSISILALFGGSIVFGWVYARTENLVVPSLAHAGLNSFSFIQLYILIEYFPEELNNGEMAAILLTVLG